MNTPQADHLPNQPAVALRSEDSELIGLVQSLIAPFALPLTVYPLGAVPPRAAVVFDSAREQRPHDPSWQGAGQIFASVASAEPHPIPTPGTGVGADRVATAGLGPTGAQVRILPQDAPIITRQLEWVVATNLAPVLGVVGASGGVGATCLAITIARESVHTGYPTVLIDCSPRASVGSYLPLGEGTRWEHLGDESVLDDGYALIESLPVWRGVRVLTGSAIGTFADVEHAVGVLAELARSSRRVIVDLGDGPHVEEVAKWCDDLLVVASSDQVGLWNVQRLQSQLAGQKLHVVARKFFQSTWAGPELAQAAGLPFAGVLGHERSLRAGLERGLEPGEQRRGPLRRAARELTEKYVGR